MRLVGALVHLGDAGEIHLTKPGLFYEYDGTPRNSLCTIGYLRISQALENIIFNDGNWFNMGVELPSRFNGFPQARVGAEAFGQLDSSGETMV